jgi:predicted phage terminase large subunit-like protein
MAAWIVYGEKLILCDIIRAKLTAPQLRRTAVDFYNKNSDHLRYMYIEDKVSGTGLIQELEEQGLRIKPVSRGIDKVTRALDAIPHIEQGKVYFYSGIKNRDALLDELALFPNGVHDDFVDVLNDAVDITFVGNRFDISAFMQ